MSINNFIRKVKLYFDPPSRGDRFYGDPLNFVVCSTIEQALHGTRTIRGDAQWSVVPSEHCYRLTVESDSMPYYRCTSEVLASNLNNLSEKRWLKRVQPRRILKEKFHEMIIDGSIERL